MWFCWKWRCCGVMWHVYSIWRVYGCKHLLIWMKDTSSVWKINSSGYLTRNVLVGQSPLTPGNGSFLEVVGILKIYALHISGFSQNIITPDVHRIFPHQIPGISVSIAHILDDRLFSSSQQFLDSPGKSPNFQLEFMPSTTVFCSFKIFKGNCPAIGMRPWKLGTMDQHKPLEEKDILFGNYHFQISCSFSGEYR